MMHNLSHFIVLCAAWLLCAGPAHAQPAQVRKSALALFPTLADARQHPERALYLDSYRLAKFTLDCTLADGTPVDIVPVNDLADFTFLAVRTGRGPAILVNERTTKGSNLAYLVFSFYRECGVHNVAKVDATGPGDGDTYSKAVIKGAECLAVLPTRALLGTDLPYASMIDNLRSENDGVITSSVAELRRCTVPNFVKAQVAAIHR